MRTSAQGVEFIASFEGFVDHPYRDPVGVWTIGYGHTGPGTQSMGQITRARGLELLSCDLATAEAAINGLQLDFTQPRFDALVSIAFNCGGGIVAASTSLGKALRRPGMDGVPAALQLYTHAMGRELPGLVRRRNAEAQMWGQATDAADGPASWLTPVELRRCRELDALRKAGTPSDEQKRRIGRARERR